MHYSPSGKSFCLAKPGTKSASAPRPPPNPANPPRSLYLPGSGHGSILLASARILRCTAIDSGCCTGWSKQLDSQPIAFSCWSSIVTRATCATCASRLGEVSHVYTCPALSLHLNSLLSFIHLFPRISPPASYISLYLTTTDQLSIDI